MHKYILIPDSFKGTLSAWDFCAVAGEAIGRADPGHRCSPSPWPTAARVRWRRFWRPAAASGSNAPARAPMAARRRGLRPAA